ncbi:MAG TPA: bestrophin family ion channel [Chitinophagaceae bacterium]|nr:bestrophin family ion channel [Chitinophagaceae bacterium]
MHTGKRYSLKEFLFWTRRDIYILSAWAIIPAALYNIAGWKWLGIPWLPIALIGTASAFLIGFRNTQTYNRLWEARQVWGAIVNSSQAWGILVKDYVTGPDEAVRSSLHRQLIYRHIAWLTALRFQLREVKPWENIKGKPSNEEYLQRYSIAEWETTMPDELKPFLSGEDAEYVLSKTNKATHIISLQSAQLRQLKEQGRIEPLNYVEMENLLINLCDQQGKCERIKNFPYPRQYTTINQMITRLFVSLIPYGSLNEFQKLGEQMSWLTIPFSVAVGWVFLAMEKVGESSENPFEGGANDVPVTAMSRAIEIDLREMLDEKDIPAPVTAVNKILT